MPYYTALESSHLSTLDGFRDTIIGIIMSANYTGLVRGSLLAPRIIRKVGYARSFAAFASLGSVSAATHILWINPFTW